MEFRPVINRHKKHLLAACMAGFGLIATPPPALTQQTTPTLNTKAALEKGFQPWLQNLWPDAQKAGVSRAVFDQAVANLTIDWALPDLMPLEGAKAAKRPQQAEFRAPKAYFPPDYLERITKFGQEKRQEHRKILTQIEQRYGVPSQILLSIWGRETSFSRAKIPYDAIRSLATLSYIGRRKELFHAELLAALQVLEQGHVSREELKSSWAGAMGHTQFLPSKFLIHGVDFDGDGKRNIWGSLDDALATTANYLKSKGWEKGKPWFYEVKLSLGFDCSLEGPHQSRSVAEWLKQGVKRTKGRAFPAHRLTENGFLVLPAGLNGPTFLALKNFSVLKEYNKSDVYALFVGHLADRIANGSSFSGKWQKVSSFSRTDIKKLQQNLTTLGFAVGQPDGLVGTRTRATIGQYQKQHGFALNCYPSKDLLAHVEKTAAGQ